MIRSRLPAAFTLASAILILTLVPPASAKAPAKLGVTTMPAELAKEVGLDGPGMPILLVSPRSAAGKAGLKPGDVVTRIGDKEIKKFSDLSRALSQLGAGTKTTIEFLRDGTPKSADLTLSAWIGDPTDASYKDAADYLRGILEKKDSVVLRNELINVLWQGGNRNGAVAAIGEAIAKYPDEDTFRSRRLDLLIMTGQYDVFAKEAIRLADEEPESAELGLQKAEALLATGQLEEAEKVALETANKAAGKNRFTVSEVATKADRAWAIARLRQGKSLIPEDPDQKQPSVRFTHPEMSVFSYWREELGDRPTYALTDTENGTELEFKAESVLFGLAPYKMHGITVKVNGTEVPLAIVDTGASHTLISTQVAKEADVRIGSTAREAVGSLSFTARPGIIDELQIGDIILRDVPVSVGNPPPLVMTKAKMAIGVDIMHHLRFTLDYKNKKVYVDPDKKDPPEPANPEAVWDIPLWTFADHVLSQATLPDGTYARTLIDSGNFAQTLVWPTWAKQHLPNHPGETGSILLYAMTNPQRNIKGLTLGGRKLPAWPVMDMPPVTLQGVDLLDLLMGHDLLSQYKVTVDMRQRRLRLESYGDSYVPPVAKKPFQL